MVKTIYQQLNHLLKLDKLYKISPSLFHAIMKKLPQANQSYYKEISHAYIVASSQIYACFQLMNLSHSSLFSHSHQYTPGEKALINCKSIDNYWYAINRLVKQIIIDKIIMNKYDKLLAGA